MIRYRMKILYETYESSNLDGLLYKLYKENMVTVPRAIEIAKEMQKESVKEVYGFGYKIVKIDRGFRNESNGTICK